MKPCITALALLLLAGCQRQEQEPPMPPPTAAPVVATEAAVGETAFPVQLQALGTEPFWTIMLDGNDLTYLTPENQAGSRAPIARSEQSGALTVSGTLEGKALQLVVKPEQCSDGMSDTAYSFSAALSLGDSRFAGCARPAPAGGKR